MNAHPFRLSGEDLRALPSGALWVPHHGLFCVSDLHLGKSERMARRGNGLLPPYETNDTLRRLDEDIAALRPETVICLGDTFDDLAAVDGMTETQGLWLSRLQAGRNWIWIEGNHDPGSVQLGGAHRVEVRIVALIFRHIARPERVMGEVSGHYHPTASIGRSGRSVRRPCFLTDGFRLILPAYGTYTGGMDSTAPEIRALMQGQTLAILTGPTQVCFPVGPNTA